MHGALIRYSRKSAALFTLVLTRVAFAKSVALSASSLFGSVSICNICVPCDKEMQKGTDIMHSSQGGAPCVHIGWVAREKKRPAKVFAGFGIFLGHF